MASGLHSPFWIPLVVFFLFPCTFIVTYIIAVKNDHVSAVFPFISDTGTEAPESCIFGQMLNIGAVLIGAIAYLRQRQIAELDRRFSLRPCVRRLNAVSTWLGYTMAFGVSLVGNFQETRVLVVHLIGALLAFGVGAIYFWVQTVLSYHTVPMTCSHLCCHVRLLFSLLSSIGFISTFVCAGVSFREFKGDPLHWTKGQPGYELHLASTIIEWLMALVFCLFLATFACEFRRIECGTPEVSFHVDEDRIPQSCKNHVTPLAGEVVTISGKRS